MDAIRAKQSISAVQAGISPETPVRQLRSPAGSPAKSADQLDLSSQALDFLRRQGQKTRQNHVSMVLTGLFILICLTFM